MAVLEFKDVLFSFGTKKFIEQMNFSVGEGELVGLMGPNGAGKSTMLKLATGILSPQSGSVLVENKSVRSYSGKERARQLAYLPQILDMQAPFRVDELIRMGAYAYNNAQGLTIYEALNLVGLADNAGAFLADLSGGERRRAYIAMTLVQGGRLLLLDEPLANLDLKYQLDLIRLLQQICREKGISVLLSLHDIGMGALLDRLIVVKNGRLIAEGQPAAVLTDEIVRLTYDLDASCDFVTGCQHSGMEATFKL